MLDLMRENEDGVQPLPCLEMLGNAHRLLKILDYEVGDEELIKAVAAEVVILRAKALADARRIPRALARSD